MLRAYEHVYVIKPDAYSELEAEGHFYRKDVRGYGVDFKFCTVSEKLTVSIRYFMNAVFNDDTFLAMIEKRAIIESTSMETSSYRALLGNNVERESADSHDNVIQYDVSEIIKAGSNFVDGETMYSIQNNYVDGDSIVQYILFESDEFSTVGNVIEYSVEKVHCLILQYLRKLYGS